MPAIPPPPRVSGLTGHNDPSGLCVADVVIEISLSGVERLNLVIREASSDQAPLEPLYALAR